MSFQFDDYEYDRNNELLEASIKKNSILYRITSGFYSDRTVILNGQGACVPGHEGRFSAPDQITTYCANNVLVSVTEVLFHMYRSLLTELRKGAKYSIVKHTMQKEKTLVAFRVTEFRDLVHLDCKAIGRDYRTTIQGTLAVWPDNTYEHFQTLNTAFRKENKTGILYPSARHSHDKCVALFKDRSTHVIATDYTTVDLVLQLIPEDQDLAKRPDLFDPFELKVHPTMGFYEIRDKATFEDLRNADEINPDGMPLNGYVEFVRRPYRSYPADAVIPV